MKSSIAKLIMKRLAFPMISKGKHSRKYSNYGHGRTISEKRKKAPHLIMLKFEILNI